MIDYEIFARKADGTRIGPLNNNEIELDVVLKANDGGVLTLTLPCCPDYTFGDFTIDTMLEVCAVCDCGTSFPIGFTPWFVERREQCEDSTGNCSIKLTCTSATGLLARREVAYDQDNAKGKCVNELADDVIKRIFRENGGDPAQTGHYNAATDPLRDLSAYISTEANESAAPAVTKTFGGQTVLAAMQTIAQASEAKGVRLFFGIYQDSCDSTQLVFRTAINQPGTVKDLVASPYNESLASYCVSEDARNSANRVYATNGNNAVSVVDSPTLAATLAANPFALREVSVSTSGTDPNSATDEGNAELTRLSKTYSVDGIMNDSIIRFGCDYNFGDKVKAFVEDRETTVVIDSLHFNQKAGLQTIEPTLSSQSAVSASGVAGLVQRVKRLSEEIDRLRALV